MSCMGCLSERRMTMYEELNVTEDTLDEIKQVVSLIPKGRDNAITGKQIRQLTGFSERIVRKYVSLARRDICILNDQNGMGYYKPETKEEVERWVNQERARAKSIFWSMRGAREYLKGVE